MTGQWKEPEMFIMVNVNQTFYLSLSLTYYLGTQVGRQVFCIEIMPYNRPNMNNLFVRYCWTDNLTDDSGHKDLNLLRTNLHTILHTIFNLLYNS